MALSRDDKRKKIQDNMDHYTRAMQNFQVRVGGGALFKKDFALPKYENSPLHTQLTNFIKSAQKDMPVAVKGEIEADFNKLIADFDLHGHARQQFESWSHAKSFDPHAWQERFDNFKAKLEKVAETKSDETKAWAEGIAGKLDSVADMETRSKQFKEGMTRQNQIDFSNALRYSMRDAASIEQWERIEKTTSKREEDVEVQMEGDTNFLLKDGTYKKKGEDFYVEIGKGGVTLLNEKGGKFSAHDGAEAIKLAAVGKGWSSVKFEISGVITADCIMGAIAKAKELGVTLHLGKVTKEWCMQHKHLDLVEQIEKNNVEVLRAREAKQKGLADKSGRVEKVLLDKQIKGIDGFDRERDKLSKVDAKASADDKLKGMLGFDEKGIDLAVDKTNVEKQLTDIAARTKNLAELRDNLQHQVDDLKAEMINDPRVDLKNHFEELQKAAEGYTKEHADLNKRLEYLEAKDVGGVITTAGVADADRDNKLGAGGLATKRATLDALKPSDPANKDMFDVVQAGKPYADLQTEMGASRTRMSP